MVPFFGKVDVGVVEGVVSVCYRQVASDVGGCDAQFAGDARLVVLFVFDSVDAGWCDFIGGFFELLAFVEAVDKRVASVFEILGVERACVAGERE